MKLICLEYGNKNFISFYFSISLPESPRQEAFWEPERFEGIEKSVLKVIHLYNAVCLRYTTLIFISEGLRALIS